ncbi:MAG: histidinol-phosphate transaminase [Flavipsychrobacter sp.]
MKQFNLESIIRSNIRSLTPYSSARSEFDGSDSVLLDANENSIATGNNNLNRYPDPLQQELKQVISSVKKISQGNIFIGNGSDEPIDLLIRMCCTPGVDNIIICPPTYGMYDVAAKINDVAVQTVVLTNEYQLNTAEILKQVNEYTKLIFICTPNNPTGNILNDSDIQLLLENFAGIVVVDEAYIDFADKRSWLCELSKYPNLVVLQTLSKAWGLAALRIGLAFGSQPIIMLLNKIKAPYNVNYLSQQAAIQALTKNNSLSNTVNTLKLQRQHLAKELISFPFVSKVYPSDANFLLVKFTNGNAVSNYLLSKKIVVRNRSNQPLCKNCLRITVGSPAENDLLITALKEYQS